MNCHKSAAIVIAALTLTAGGIGPFLVNDLSPHSQVASGGSARAGKYRVRACGVAELSNRDVDLIERIVEIQQRRQGLQRGQAIPAAGSLGTIQVAFHVVYTTVGGVRGLLTQEEVNAQIQALNAAFDNVDFELFDTTFTNNNAWFRHEPGSANELAMKSALGLDSSRYLNLYSTGLSEIGLLGYATFPWSRRLSPTLDGVVVSYDSLPGGEFPYDEGDTAVHEIGHWLGLYHTFQGGCTSLNDRVFDTPAEARPYFGCTLSPPNTCPSAGLDPIENFMDYSDDACLVEFTAGQVARMNLMLFLFRQNALN